MITSLVSFVQFSFWLFMSIGVFLVWVILACVVIFAFVCTTSAMNLDTHWNSFKNKFRRKKRR